MSFVFQLKLRSLTRGNLIGLSLLVIAACVFVWSGYSALGAGRASATPSPTPTPSPPVVEFLAVPNREVVKRNEQVAVSLLITNKSDKPIYLLDVAPARKDSSGTGAPFTGIEEINSELKPFRSETPTLTITATDNAPFAQNKLLLLLRYSWKMGNEAVSSMQTATIPITVQRPFEEEAKGFPGGTAAFLYFLLPIIPAILSYQFVEHYRKGEGLHMPSFKAEHIVPAFFLAVAFSFIVLQITKSKGGVNYSSAWVFLLVLGISLVVGATVPFFRLLHDSYQSRTWGFKDNDEGPDYLRKALLSPWSPSEFSWATGKVGKITWQGILLEQPGGAKVLGATVQISRSDNLDGESWENAQRELFRGDAILDRERLLEMIEAGQLTVEVMDPILEGVKPLRDTYVAVGKVKGFQQTNIEVRNLLRPLT